MTLAWFAKQLVESELGWLKECYVAVIPNLNDDGTWTYHLEVENEPFAEIIGVHDTGIRLGDRQLEEVLNARRSLGEELTKLGVKVYATREQWEKTIDEQEAGEAAG